MKVIKTEVEPVARSGATTKKSRARAASSRHAFAPDDAGEDSEPAKPSGADSRTRETSSAGVKAAKAQPAGDSAVRSGGKSPGKSATPARPAKKAKQAAKKSAKKAAKKSAKKRTGSSRARRSKAKIDPEDLLTLSSERLLRRWIESRRDEWRDAIVERHLPDVVDIARALRSRLPRSVDIDDLCNAGYGGLLRCLETFNPKKGRSFQSYLKTRVYGAMVDELRAMDWLPRLMRSRLARRDSLADSMRQDLGREPVDEELAQALGVSLKAYRRSYPTLGPNPSSGFLSGNELDLDRLDASIIALGARGRGPDEEVHPLTSMYHQELMSRVEELCNATEWKLVRLHYFKGLKLRDIAVKLRLSPARICQIHGRVLQRLKERLREEALSI